MLIIIIIIISMEMGISRPQFGHHCQYSVGSHIGGMNRPLVVQDNGDCSIDYDEGKIVVKSTWKAAHILTSDKGRFLYDSSRHENPYCDAPIVGVYINAPVLNATYLWVGDADEVTFVATCASWNRAVQTSITVSNVKATKFVFETKKETAIMKKEKKQVQFRFTSGVPLTDDTAPNSLYHNVYYVCQSYDLRHLKDYDAIGFSVLEDTSEMGAQFIRGPVVGENIFDPLSSRLNFTKPRVGSGTFVHHAVVFAWYSEEELETTTQTRGFSGVDVQEKSPFMCRFFPYKRLMFAWSGGNDTLYLPDNVGFPIPDYITIQAHYMIPAREGKNKNRDVGIRLSSSIVTDRFGLELTLEPRSRERKSAGYMVLGARNDRVLAEVIYVPSGMTHFKHQSSCFSSSCRLNWPHRIYLTGLLFHTHFLGRQLRFVSISNSKIKTLASAHVGRNTRGNDISEITEFHEWDPSNPTMHSTAATMLVEPNDRLALTCTCDSSSRYEETIGGLGALDEMCWVFAFYYDVFETPLGVEQKNSDGCCFTGMDSATKFYPPLQRDTDSKALQYEQVRAPQSLKDLSPYLLMHSHTTPSYIRQSGIDNEIDSMDGVLLYVVVCFTMVFIFYLFIKK